MKFGCLYYVNSENIGDDIQSYAQWKFLPQVDYWIDRESLHTFCSEDGETVALIMNAWFMYSPENWPPSPYIKPLFVSSHFSRYHMKWLDGADEKYKFGQQYLKENGPIGCRDGGTMLLLQSLDIEAYFSGCLTLTISPFADVQKEDYICVVDVPTEITSYIQIKGYNVRIMTHTNKQLSVMRPEDRLKQAERYLKIYQGARCVVTTRLHCALPCTGLGTPVLVLPPSDLQERFQILRDFIYMTDVSSILAGKWDDFFHMPTRCKSEYSSYRDNLTKICNEFVVKSIKSKIVPDVCRGWYEKAIFFQDSIRKEIYNTEIEQLSTAYESMQKMNMELRQWSEDLQNERKIYMEKNISMQNMVSDMLEKVSYYSSKISVMQKAIEDLRKMNEELRAWSEDLEKENRRLKNRRWFK